MYMCFQTMPFISINLTYHCFIVLSFVPLMCPTLQVLLPVQ